MMEMMNVTREIIESDEAVEEREDEKYKGPLPYGEWLRSQILANQMCTMEILCSFAVIELYAESTHALYMQLEKRGKLLWETMGAIRGWETQQMEWVLGDNYGERVLNLIVEYIGFID
jgi:hypothetical protein